MTRMPQGRIVRPATGTLGAETQTDAQRTIQQAHRERHEVALFETLKRAGLPLPETQYRYVDGRKWAADFAYPAAHLLIEVQGGVWTGGRHTRGKGYEEDRVKFAEAQLRGWLVIEVTPVMIGDGRALSLIERALAKASE